MRLVNVLTYDMRNHGASGAANGGVAAAGLYEWRDVAGAVDDAGAAAGIANACGAAETPLPLDTAVPWHVRRGGSPVRHLLRQSRAGRHRMARYGPMRPVSPGI